MRNITAFILAISLVVLPCASYGGDIVKLSCNNCDFESKEVHIGSGMDGIENEIIYCKECNKLYTVPTMIQSWSRFADSTEVLNILEKYQERTSKGDI